MQYILFNDVNKIQFHIANCDACPTTATKDVKQSPPTKKEKKEKIYHLDIMKQYNNLNSRLPCGSIGAAEDLMLKRAKGNWV